jgi:hypothetical protein
MGGTEPQVRERAFHVAAQLTSSLILYAGNFFKDYGKDIPSGIKSRFAESGNLQHVTARATKDLNWAMDKKPQNVETDNLPLRFLEEPPPKKFKDCR